MVSYEDQTTSMVCARVAVQGNFSLLFRLFLGGHTITRSQEVLGLTVLGVDVVWSTNPTVSIQLRRQFREGEKYVWYCIFRAMQR